MPYAIIVANMNILGQKLNEVLRAKPTDGRTGRRTDKRADGKCLQCILRQAQRRCIKAFHSTIHFQNRIHFWL